MPPLIGDPAMQQLQTNSKFPTAQS